MKRLLLIALTCILLFSCPLAIAAADLASEGISLGENSRYALNEALPAAPNTVEAWVYIPKTLATDRVGELLGNYGYNQDDYSCIDYGIFKKRNPRIYWKDPDETLHDHVFTKVTLPMGQWCHLTLVRDLAAGYIRCYLNGALMQSIAIESSEGTVCTEGMVIGGDMRARNSASFQGRIKSLAVYADVRSQKEIRADMKTPASDDLLLYYDFTTGYTDAPDTLTDCSGNGMDAKRSTVWMDIVEETKGYAYSFAVIGDTQIVARNHPDSFHNIYDWILENKEKKNIQFVIGLGDITDKSTEAEWKVATENIFRLDGVIPYSLARGNHDTKASFHNALTGSAYVSSFAGRMTNRFENVYHTLTVGEVQYLILTLDYGPTDSVLKWANDVVAAHPEHNVIVVTHAYLNENGKTLDYGFPVAVSKAKGYVDGAGIWENLVSQHKNIVMVLSGHIAADNIVMTQRQGVHGNTVTEMLLDTQGVDSSLDSGAGIVAMFYFSEDGKEAQVEYYSTIRKQYYLSSNRYTFTVDTVDASATFPKVKTYTDSFTDVAEDAWYYAFVKNAYEVGLAGGTSATAFSPDHTFTVAQALTAAANIHKTYHGKTLRAAAAGEAWYAPYVEYCTENGIIQNDQFAHYDASITRGDMAIVFANILPEEEYAAIRSGSISDVTVDMQCASAVQKLYDAGIVSGDGGTDNYRPSDSLKRSEACVIFTRIALQEMRAR